MNSQLEEKLAGLPVGTGVYLMKDRHGEVLYVGKAVNLRSRVRSYFAKAGVPADPPASWSSHSLPRVP